MIIEKHYCEPPGDAELLFRVFLLIIELLDLKLNADCPSD